jgi:hypothetical protein
LNLSLATGRSCKDRLLDCRNLIQLWKFWLEERDQHPKLILPAPAQLTQASFLEFARAKVGEFLYLEALLRSSRLEAICGYFVFKCDRTRTF